MLPALPVLLAVTLSTAPTPPVLSELPKPEGIYELKHDFWGDGAVTAVAGTGWLLSEVAFKRQFAPTECRWCEQTGSTDTLNGFDAWGRGMRWENTATAAKLSDLTGMVLMPLTMVGGEAYLALKNRAASELPTDYLIILESTALAGLFNQAVKFAVARERPYAHFAALAGTSMTASPDDNVSFFSGHTNLAFVLTVATGTVAELRGYEGRWVIWAVGLPLSVATAYLRVAADKHYLTDVLVGALSGSAFGFLVPTVFHGRGAWKPISRSDFEAQLTAGPGGLAVVGKF